MWTKQWNITGLTDQHFHLTRIVSLTQNSFCQFYSLTLMCHCKRNIFRPYTMRQMHDIRNSSPSLFIMYFHLKVVKLMYQMIQKFQNQDKVKNGMYSKQLNNLICIPELLERNLHHKKERERERTRGTCQCALMGCETLVILTVSGDAFYVSPGKICVVVESWLLGAWHKGFTGII